MEDVVLKRLRPSLRYKKRYLRVKIICEKKFSFETLQKEIEKNLVYFIGVIDYTKANVWFLKNKFNFEKQEIIIKIFNKFLNKFKSALCLIPKIENLHNKIEIKKISGTIKGVLSEPKKIKSHDE